MTDHIFENNNVKQPTLQSTKSQIFCQCCQIVNRPVIIDSMLEYLGPICSECKHFSDFWQLLSKTDALEWKKKSESVKSRIIEYSQKKKK